MIDVALFPIPNCVTFPGNSCPLHVFEPRYRQMVRHCIDNNMPMGVCNTQKVLHANTKQQSLKEALHSNQSTYKPCEVFSAGEVELVKEMADGRLAIKVHLEMRLRLHREKQTLPFSIWECDIEQDFKSDENDRDQLALSKEKILKRLVTMTHNVSDVHEFFKSDYWQNMPVYHFSFAICGLLGTEPEVKQFLLETKNTQQRLDYVLAMINSSD